MGGADWPPLHFHAMSRGLAFVVAALLAIWGFSLNA